MDCFNTKSINGVFNQLCKNRSNVIFSSLCSVIKFLMHCALHYFVWHYISVSCDWLKLRKGKELLLLYYEEFRQYPDQMWFYYYVYTMCFILVVLIIAWLGNSREWDLHTVQVLGLDNFWQKQIWENICLFQCFFLSFQR